MEDVRGTVAAALIVVAVLYSGWFIAAVLGQLPPAGVALAAQPLAISLLMWTLLRRRCTSGSARATVASRAIAFLYVPWSILGALTIAIGAFPVAALLAAAAAITPAPARAA